MSRKDSLLYLHRRLKVKRRRRLSAAEGESFVRDSDEPGSSPSSVQDADDASGRLTLHSHRVIDESLIRGSNPSDCEASTAAPMDLRWLAQELQRQLKDKALENEMLKEALEAARHSRVHSANRHRR